MRCFQFGWRHWNGGRGTEWKSSGRTCSEISTEMLMNTDCIEVKRELHLAWLGSRSITVMMMVMMMIEGVMGKSVDQLWLYDNNKELWLRMNCCRAAGGNNGAGRRQLYSRRAAGSLQPHMHWESDGFTSISAADFKWCNCETILPSNCGVRHLFTSATCHAFLK